jgi:hypothetical protein
MRHETRRHFRNKKMEYLKDKIYELATNNKNKNTRAQNYWVFGLLPSSGVSGSGNTVFQKLDLFPPSGEGGEDTYSVGSLRKS